jgi:hypothetical protein
MADFQAWLIHALLQFRTIGGMMRTRLGWPMSESIHFIGLCLLAGAIFLFDLRLLGVGKRIPLGALHKLIPWGLLGYAMTLLSGVTFLMTEPDQYIYNPSFHFKMLFMALAGINASAFYLTSYRTATAPDAPPDAPRSAKFIAVCSLSLWIGVIVAGRLLTFYRPGPCGPGGPGFLATCQPDPER